MGVFNFMDNSDEFEKALDEQLEAGLEAVGLAAERFAKKNCPVDSGRLRNSISHDVASENGEKAAYIGTNISYAPYVEIGTSSKKRRYKQMALTRKFLPPLGIEPDKADEIIKART